MSQQAARMTPPRLLQIEPTTRCNFRCAFCCGRRLPQGDMSLGTFQVVLDTFPSLEHILLQGEGEPLLNPGFFEMVARARNAGARVSTITNGSLFSPENVDRILEADVDKVLVSIESPEPVRFRALRGGDLARVMRGTEHLVSRRVQRGLTRPAIGLAVVVLRSTRHELPGIVSLYRTLGLDGGMGVFQPLERVEPYTRHYDPAVTREMLSEREWADIVEAARADVVMRTILDEGSRHPAFFEALSHYWPLQPGRCPWLEHAGFVAWDGTLGPCCTVKDVARHGFGRIGHDDVEHLSAARDVLRRELDGGAVPRPCQGCEVAERVVRPRAPGEPGAASRAGPSPSARGSTASTRLRDMAAEALRRAWHRLGRS